ncbi:MAG: hypothetical protein NZM25_01675 [Leptospiraceae bacterium]|nr:hypothetical protein [Leptospiraceae bacterium]MDW8306886.1 hypothetical protein [Leptospiraceae bacterium]
MRKDTKPNFSQLTVKLSYFKLEEGLHRTHEGNQLSSRPVLRGPTFACVTKRGKGKAGEGI